MDGFSTHTSREKGRDQRVRGRRKGEIGAAGERRGGDESCEREIMTGRNQGRRILMLKQLSYHK